MDNIIRNKKETLERIKCLREGKSQHHIFFEWYLNGRAGGPPGYLANLVYGLNQIEHCYGPQIIFDTYKGSAPKKNTNNKGLKDKIKQFIKNMICILPDGKNIYAEHFSKYQREQFNALNAFLSNADSMYPDNNLISNIDFSVTKTIHVHTVIDVVKVKNFLKNNFYDDVLVILTCHTPESYAQEQYNLYIDGGQSRSRAQTLKDKWYKIELEGYKQADIMIFPSKEAMDPFIDSIPEFADIIKNKDIRFMPTGSKELTSSMTQEEAKKKYNIMDNKKVVGYIGRHNFIKGYDLLKAAAEIVLSKRDDVVFLIGGTKGDTIKSLNNSNWIEAGWVNPSDLFRALDLFVLPNRQTYYDLVLLEVLSMGVPVVATATGGNISVKKNVDDIILTEVSAEKIAQAIMTYLDSSDSKKVACRSNMRDAYEKYFTEKKMAERYVRTICDIYRDYELEEI